MLTLLWGNFEDLWAWNFTTSDFLGGQTHPYQFIYKVCLLEETQLYGKLRTHLGCAVIILSSYSS